jgi:hypothetical protein
VGALGFWGRCRFSKRYTLNIMGYVNAAVMELIGGRAGRAAGAGVNLGVSVGFLCKLLLLDRREGGEGSESGW